MKPASEQVRGHVTCVCEQEGDGEWVSLDSEIIMKNGEPIGTQTPTGHYVLLDTRFEPPPGMSSSSRLVVVVVVVFSRRRDVASFRHTTCELD